MLRQLDYQDRVLTAIDAYLDVLKVKKALRRQSRRLGLRQTSLGRAEGGR